MSMEILLPPTLPAVPTNRTVAGDPVNPSPSLLLFLSTPFTSIVGMVNVAPLLTVRWLNRVVLDPVTSGAVPPKNTVLVPSLNPPDSLLVNVPFT